MEEEHPSPVVESIYLRTVSLPDIVYQLPLPQVTIDSGVLSSLQLKSIIYACQRHEQKTPDGSRGGYLVGDGTGFGKGRIAAGIIFVNHLHGRKKAVWLSMHRDLQYDAERDLRDVADTQVTIFNLKKLNLLSADENGVAFSTYSTLTEEFHVNNKKSTRLQQLLEWCGPDYDGVIVFDECHHTNLLDLSGTKILFSLLELQTKLPNARIIYMSVTGVSSDLRNMAFMSRLGLWGLGTSFPDFKDFHQTLEKDGLHSREMMAMELKLRGMYLARRMDLKDVKFRMVEVGSSHSPKFCKIYDNAINLWTQLKQSFVEVEEILNTEQRIRQGMWDYFRLAHSCFFKDLCNAAKVTKAVELANGFIRGGKCVVISVRTTGEVHTLEEMKAKGGNVSNFISTGKRILLSLVEKHFPVISSINPSATDRKRKNSESDETEEERLKRVLEIKDHLLMQIETFSAMLPLNVFDQLIDELGGPDKVSEISSRRGRVIQKDDGQIQYEHRFDANFPSNSNISEKELFMQGHKNVAIVSEDCSSGISLQADSRVNNQRTRVYIALELPSSVEVAIQQFCSTHRCNQVCNPEYILLYSNLAGEEKFASNVARRLTSFGAVNLYVAQRIVTTFGISELTLETKYAQQALVSTFQAVLDHNNGSNPIVPPPSDYLGEFFSDAKTVLVGAGLMAIDDTNTLKLQRKTSVKEFFETMLGFPARLQTSLFKYFAITEATILAKENMLSESDGINIFEWGAGQIVGRKKIHKITSPYSTARPLCFARIELHTFEFDQGTTWKQAHDMSASLSGNSEGFYLSNLTRNGKHSVFLVFNNCQIRPGQHGESFTAIRPDMRTAFEFPPKAWEVFKMNHKKVAADSPQRRVVEEFWNLRYNASKTDCSHRYWTGQCIKKDQGLECQHGLRLQTLNVLCGPIFSAWKDISSVIGSMQVVRVKFNDIQHVGLIIPENFIEPVLMTLYFKGLVMGVEHSISDYAQLSLQLNSL